MDPCAAVMTGPGAGAIATIGLRGNSAATLLETVFRPCSTGKTTFEVGRIVLGHIVDDSVTIDQVTVGCEGPDTFAIHCHGNPLIVEAIMKLLQRHGARLLAASAWQAQRLAEEGGGASIAIEVKQALTTVKTVEGARMLSNQIAGGLGRWCRQWQAGSMSLERVKGQAAKVLRDSDVAKWIISGCTVVLIGPPNTGKSTLLNALAGREKAIVTDIEGTTRDWVSAEIHIPPLAATVIDTAGLDAAIADDRIDQAAQTRSMETLRQADLVLLVLDASQPVHDMPESAFALLNEKRVAIVLNKADLPEDPEMTLRMPGFLNPVRISARDGVGIDELIQAIHQTLGVDTLDPHTPVAFTDRQRDLLERLVVVKSASRAAGFIDEILHGPVEG